MKIPFWKRWLSYLDEIPLERVSSDLNPYLQVGIRSGKLILSTEKAIYSFDENYDNFGHAFSQVNLPPQGSKVLVLGGGLGSIPLLLEKVQGLKYHFVIIEKDEAVIELFSKYTLPRLNSSVQVIEADAYSYVLQLTETYPLICMDVFKSDIIPALFKSTEYLEKLNSGLESGGLLLYNCLAQTDADINQTQAFLDNEFLQVFPKAGYIKAYGNWILLNDTAHSKLSTNP